MNVNKNIITSADELEALCEDIDRCGRFAIDLEFIPERTYEPVLCVVQVATDNTARIIDPLALTDLSALWERVGDPNIMLVLHAANQDLDLIYNISGFVPHQVFDTQIAAGFAGFGYPIGYGKLLQQLLGVSIAKTESFTDWMGRPLTDSQIEYALEDVCHLLPMYDKLCEILSGQGRLQWAQEECKRYVEADRYQRDRTMDFLRIKGASGLNRRGLALLQTLSSWRHDEASRSNRPIRSVLSDNILVELARRPAHKIADIQRMRGIRVDQVKQYGNALLKAVEEGLKIPETELPIWPSSRIPPKREVLMADMLFALLKVITYESDIATELVCTRDELQALTRLHRDGKTESSTLPLLQGWRREMAGDRLLKVLDGAPLTVTFDNDPDKPIKLKF